MDIALIVVMVDVGSWDSVALMVRDRYVVSSLRIVDNNDDNDDVDALFPR